MNCPLNRTSSKKMILLFDYCFKQGVLDACAVEDDYAVQEWVNERFKDGKYGVLSDPDNTFEWKHWRFVLYRWCRNIRLPSLGEGYIDRVRSTSNFYFVALPMAMRFYIMGVQEWLEYPNPNNTVVFKQTAKIHWKPVPKHLKKMNVDDFISYIQEFVYEAKNRENKEASDASYDSFAMAMWQLTRKYPTYVDFRAREKKEEDV